LLESNRCDATNMSDEGQIGLAGLGLAKIQHPI